jgi:hypothetical protein
VSSDEDVLRRFGYRSQLKRTLRPWAIFGIAFSFMSITTSVYTSFGFGLGKLGTASVWLWPAVLAGQLLAALPAAAGDRGARGHGGGQHRRRAAVLQD